MITIKNEISLYEFKAWQGGKETLANIIEAGKVEMLEDLLNECYEELTATELNDILWFATDWIYEQLDMEEYTEDYMEQLAEEFEDHMENLIDE